MDRQTLGEVVIKILARAIGGVVVAVLAVSVLTAAPANADGVPEEWGDPTFESAGVGVSARHDGRIPGRPGNQHVTTFSLPNPAGEITDWWCPRGVTAPVWADSVTECKAKARYSIRLDVSAGGTIANSWSPKLAYLTFRGAVEVVDYPYDKVVHTAAVKRGTISLRLKSQGALSLSIEPTLGDRSSILTRSDGYVVGGKVLGKAWLKMSSIQLTTDLYIYRYYEPL